MKEPDFQSKPFSPVSKTGGQPGAPSGRIRILQVFNRYLEYGGEEGSVYRIADALHEFAEAEHLFSSSSEFIRDHSYIWQAAINIMYNGDVVQRLRRLQNARRFDVWQIHNVFPFLSPAVYMAGFDMGVPIVQYLHNYRMSCVNGFFLNHGEPCTRCIEGNFFPALQTACWHDSHLKSGWMGVALSYLRANHVFEKVSAWVALSKRQKQLHVKMGIPESRIRVIPHFYEGTGNPAPPRSVENNVLFLGRLSEEKGVGVLLDAWKLLKPGKSRLLIAGTGSERAKLEQRVAREQIANVDFLGFVQREEMGDLWARASFLVYSSIWEEPFGMGVLEAWDWGRTVVAPAVGGLQDTIDDGINGLKIPPRDPVLLAAAIERLLLNPDEAWQMGQNGMRKLRAEFTKELWLIRMRELFSQVCGKEVP